MNVYVFDTLYQTFHFAQLKMELLEEKGYRVCTGGLWPGCKSTLSGGIGVASLLHAIKLMAQLVMPRVRDTMVKKGYRVYTSGLGPGFKPTLSGGVGVVESTGDKTMIMSTSEIKCSREIWGVEFADGIL